MLGNWGSKASWYYLLRHVRIGVINSRPNSHNTSSKLAKQSFWSLAPARSNSTPLGGFALYKTHSAPPFHHVGAREYATSRRRSVNWQKRTISWGSAAVIGAFGYYIYYELSLRWPGYQLKNLDKAGFSSQVIDWDSPVDIAAYHHYLHDVCFRYWDRMIRVPEFTLNQKTRERAQMLVPSINFFLQLSRENLEQIVKHRTDIFQGEEIDSIVSRLVDSQCQMREAMKQVAHQVHSLLDHPPRWESRTLGYDLRMIAVVVLEAFYIMIEIAQEHSTNDMLMEVVFAQRRTDNKNASDAIRTGTEES
ncbi:hypothetical protein BDP27DRAFT_1420479 [Rhodocollybia butyracea]|uniref:Uncharacterized protein n=1 Tax=Rhodocollybia butyracea TaxID=206335 RepID=A0A9P5PU51_9AGAR|nr:hypothetical protein BDP27DRAFT_1420479 [Rhodocollybia butyracea]